MRALAAFCLSRNPFCDRVKFAQRVSIELAPAAAFAIGSTDEAAASFSTSLMISD